MEEIKYKIANGRPAVVTSSLTKLSELAIAKLTSNPSNLPIKFTQVKVSNVS
jgi:hypothetical protein